MGAHACSQRAGRQSTGDGRVPPGSPAAQLHTQGPVVPEGGGAWEGARPGCAGGTPGTRCHSCATPGRPRRLSRTRRTNTTSCPSPGRMSTSWPRGRTWPGTKRSSCRWVAGWGCSSRAWGLCPPWRPLCSLPSRLVPWRPAWQGTRTGPSQARTVLCGVGAAPRVGAHRVATPSQQRHLTWPRVLGARQAGCALPVLGRAPSGLPLSAARPGGWHGPGVEALVLPRGPTPSVTHAGGRGGPRVPAGPPCALTAGRRAGGPGLLPAGVPAALGPVHHQAG